MQAAIDVQVRGYAESEARLQPASGAAGAENSATSHVQSGDQGQERSSGQYPHPPSLAARPSFTPEEYHYSRYITYETSRLAFQMLGVALQQIHNKSVHQMVHVYMVYISFIARVKDAVELIEREVPWMHLATFLNAQIEFGHLTSKALSARFPIAEKGINRPLPEDFVIRGFHWTIGYFPETFFVDAAVDDEERTLELPSMAAPRVERILWLARRIAALGKWLHFDASTKKFAATAHVDNLPAREIAVPEGRQVSPTPGVTAGHHDQSVHQVPAVISSKTTRSERKIKIEPPTSPEKITFSTAPTILKRENVLELRPKEDVEMQDAVDTRTATSLPARPRTSAMEIDPSSGIQDRNIGDGWQHVSHSDANLTAKQDSSHLESDLRKLELMNSHDQAMTGIHP